MGVAAEAESRVDDLAAGVRVVRFNGDGGGPAARRQRGVLGSRLDLKEYPALQTKALWQDGAIQAALAGVACPGATG